MRDTVLCLCDYTGMFAEPWRKEGYRVILVDPEHPQGVTWLPERNTLLVGHKLNHSVTWQVIRENLHRLVFVAAFPVCTDLAGSGTSRWQAKAEKDPFFQTKAMILVHECRVVGEMAGCPYFFENPRGRIPRLYRKWDFWFNPNEYGGYLPEDDRHPFYPDYFPPQDAYTKATCIWTGGPFIIPPKKPVPLQESKGQGGSDSHNRLGGTSKKTKMIRSATPRGFSAAVFQYNRDWEIFT